MSSTLAGPPPPAEVALQRIGQIAVLVRDTDRAVRFYRDTLGLRLLFQAPPGLAFFDCGGVRIMLTHPEGAGQDGGTSILYYAVDDIHQSYATLTARGVRFVDEPHIIARMPDHDLWMTAFRDSEDNVLALMSEAKR